MRILYLYFMLGYGVIFFKTKGFFSSLLHTQIEQFEVAISTIIQSAWWRLFWKLLAAVVFIAALAVLIPTVFFPREIVRVVNKYLKK